MLSRNFLYERRIVILGINEAFAAKHSRSYAEHLQIAKEKNDFVKFLPLHLVSSITKWIFKITVWLYSIFRDNI